ncbi:MAG: Pr6Pr family membrane protein [Henriciella sp.]
MLIFRVALFALSWLTLIAQYLLMVPDHTDSSLIMATLNFFGYFTILTVTSVALATTVPVIHAARARGIWAGSPGPVFETLLRFFDRPAVRAGIGLNILLVCVVYNTLLAPIHNPTGLGALTNTSLHTLIPVLYLIDWALYSDKSDMRYEDLAFWIIYPGAYGVFHIFRGLIFGNFVYPFLDINELGAISVSVNMLILGAVYVIGAVAFISFGRRGWGGPPASD